MKQVSRCLPFLLALLVAASFSGAAFAQGQADTMPARPIYARLPPHALAYDVEPPAVPLPTWSGSYVYKSQTYKYTMVGRNPSSGLSTTTPVYIIPLKLVFGTQSFTPQHVLSNGKTAIQNTSASPVFADMDWVTPKGTDLGTTQYEDAYQRGNFWGKVSKATGYHVLLGKPKVEPLQTLTVPAADGQVGTEFGVRVGLADINWFDAQIEPMLTSLSIPANALPIFLTYDVYLTEGECCIGGYHSYTGTQAYSMFTYIGTPGAFSQDVSALSHEVGEWVDDPLTNNTDVPSLCGQTGNQILEVGDPEEVFTNYGAFPYTVGGYTYNLQDLVYLEYFGAPTTTSVDSGAMTFHDNPFGLSVCSNGG
jgi:hypothetical protein